MTTSVAMLHELRNRHIAARSAIINRVQAEKRSHLSADETRQFKDLQAKLTDIDAQIADLEDDANRSGRNGQTAAFIARATAKGGESSWATRAAKTFMPSESRAVTSGSWEVPTLVDPAVTPKSRPMRLVDLLVNRSTLQSNAFEYLRQTVRTINAAPVADGATKPTSVFTLAPVNDRARVLAHLSEAVPIRYFQDAADVVRFLEVEMQEGVYTALESQVINGSGTGENLTGILTVAGTTAVAYATDVPTTLRRAITALQNIGVMPNAWALNPADAEALDLLKEGTGGIGFLLDGVNNGTANSANVLGDPSIQRVISPSIPAGTAILADWNAIRLYVRQQMTLDLDTSGTLFDTNSAKMRAEIRVGLGHLHPASVAICDLTP